MITKEQPKAKITFVEKVNYLREANKVERSHTYPKLFKESVGEHTINMLNLLMELHPKPSLNLIKAVTKHDSAERITGDLPSPFKKISPELAAAFKQGEKAVEEYYGLSEPLTQEEKNWLKAIDKLDFRIWLESEKAMGNQYVNDKLWNIKRIIQSDPTVPEAVKKASLEYKFEPVNEYDFYKHVDNLQSKEESFGKGL